MVLQILQRCPISCNTSKSGSSMTLPFGESSTPCQQQRQNFPTSAWLVKICQVCVGAGGGGGGGGGGWYHISNDMVVPALRSVHSQDAKHYKNHCPSVDQRAHRRAAAHTATARVEAKRLGRLSVGHRWRVCENRIKERKKNHFKAFIYTELENVYMLSAAVITFSQALLRHGVVQLLFLYFWLCCESDWRTLTKKTCFSVRLRIELVELCIFDSFMSLLL